MDGIDSNKIRVEDPNTEPFDIRTRAPNTIRMFKNGHSVDSRRYHSFYNSHNENKSYSQSCGILQYNVDFTFDRWTHGDYEQPLDVLWISFKIE